jgi:menaquinone-dependent protoporphyrinogen oxidase
MMRVLVTAASKYGATAEIAAAIAESLAGHGLEATVLSPEEVKGVDGYDAVVVGSAVYAGHWLKPARELVERHAGVLAGRPVWLFSSGPVGDPPKPEEDPGASGVRRQAGPQAAQLPGAGDRVGSARPRGGLPGLDRDPPVGGRHR